MARGNSRFRGYFIASLSRTGASAKTQVLSRTSTGGTVTLTVGTDGPTATIAADGTGFTAAAVNTALLALGSVDVGDIAVTGSAGGPLTVTGGIANITINNTSATGGTVTNAITAAVEGGAEIVPIGSLTDAAELTPAVRSSQGWSFGAGEIDVPDMSSTFPKTEVGLFDKASPSLMIYRNDDAGSDDRRVEALLAPLTTGFVVRLTDDEVAAVGSAIEVWPVRVRSAARNPDSDATTGAPKLVTVQFSVIDEPQLNLVVSA